MVSSFYIRIRKGLFILLAVTLYGLVLLGMGSVLVFLNSGADRSSILHLDTDIRSVYRPHVILDSSTNEGRQIDPAARQKLIRDYLNAWYTRNEAFRYNDPILLRDHYTDSAFAKLKRVIEFNKNSGISVWQTSLLHNISIDFYSEDGKLATLSDRNVELYKQIRRNDDLQSESKDTIDYRIVLFLEDNYWRIRHMLRLESSDVQAMDALEARDTTVNISTIKGVNYYPKEHPWDMFGANFDSLAIASDFQKISAMGLNTVRIFIPFEEFGGADVKSSHVSQLKQLMDAADTEGIKILLTLFDFYGNYELADWTLSFQHARSLVTAFKDHPALLAWDLKNEPDLDFKNRGKDRVLAWLRELNKLVNALDQKHPVTIGWSNAEAATLLSPELDFVSFHFYGNAENFQAAYKGLSKSTPGKAILLQEYGMSSYSGFWNGFAGSENKQAAYHESIQNITSELELPFLFWTLYDYPKTPEKVVGRLPWRRLPQKYYGCLDVDGRPKASFSTIKQK